MIKQGHLLIAPPRMADLRFQETVIMITHHKINSLGLILNKPLPNTLSDIADPMGIELQRDWPLYWGGPVAPGTVWVLHDSGWGHPHSLTVNDQWSVLSHPDMLQQFQRDSLPLHFRIFMGCASWAPEQLIMEVQGDPPWSADTSWLTLCDPDPNTVLWPDPEDHWRMTTEQSLRQAAAQCLI